MQKERKPIPEWKLIIISTPIEKFFSVGKESCHDSTLPLRNQAKKKITDYAIPAIKYWDLILMLQILWGWFVCLFVLGTLLMVGSQEISWFYEEGKTNLNMTKCLQMF